MQNRRKYKQEANGLIITSRRFKRFNKIHITDNDPINVLQYPSYYLSYLEEEQDKFFSELDLCYYHIKSLKGFILGIEPKKLQALQSFYQPKYLMPP